MTAPLSQLVTVDEFKLWPGVLVGDDETTSADYVLVAASNYVRVESGNPDRWADVETAPASVKTLVVQVAARVWRNPTAATMLTTGPFSEQFGQAVEAALTLSPSERGTLARLTARPKLWTVTTTRDDYGPDDAATYDMFSGESVPASPYPGDWLYGSPA